MTLQAEFFVNDTLAATATQVGVFVDMTRKRPVKIPDVIRTLFEQSQKGQEAFLMETPPVAPP
jgi:acyl-CoA thioesterase FadM